MRMELVDIYISKNDWKKTVRGMGKINVEGK